jgi:hypothetical protein
VTGLVCRVRERWRQLPVSVGWINRVAGWITGFADRRGARIGTRFDARLGGRFDARFGGRFDTRFGGRFDGRFDARFGGRFDGRFDARLGGRLGVVVAGFRGRFSW